MMFKHQPIVVLRRLKLTGMGYHFGIRVDHNVYDYSANGGLQVKTLEGFGAGLEVEETYVVPWHDEMSARARLQMMIAAPGQYRLLDRNCENFANWVATGHGKSDQINGLMFVGAVALLAVASK